MMNRAIAVLISAGVAIASFSATAAGPTVTVPQAVSAVEVISCPRVIEHVPLGLIHQYPVPSGWSDDVYGGGGYSGASLSVNKHWMSTDGHKLYCGYGARSGISDYVLIQIMQTAPGGRTCAKSSNFTFRCTMNVMKLRK